MKKYLCVCLSWEGFRNVYERGLTQEEALDNELKLQREGFEDPAFLLSQLDDWGHYFRINILSVSGDNKLKRMPRAEFAFRHCKTDSESYISNKRNSYEHYTPEAFVCIKLIWKFDIKKLETKFKTKNLDVIEHRLLYMFKGIGSFKKYLNHMLLDERDSLYHEKFAVKVTVPKIYDFSLRYEL